MPRENPEIYEFGEFRLDVSERRLERRGSGDSGSIPEKAFQTLVALIRNPGTLMTKTELLTSVWPDTVVEENNLGKAIHAIRQFLGDRGPHHIYVETIPKHGYRFIGAVKRIDRRQDGSSIPITVSPPEAPRIFPALSPAYDLYVRGKVKAGSENINDTDDAIKVLEAATAIDPFFAPAFAQLARAYNTRAFKFAAGPQRKLLHENADVSVEKALSLDPDLAEGHFARGLILWTNTKGFPHEQAIRAFRRSLELDPDFDEAHHQLSMVYSHVGLLDEAQNELEKALNLNPNNTMARFRVGVYCGYQGRFDDAMRVFKTIPRDVSPMLVERCKAEVLVQLGRLTDAESIVDRQLSQNPQDEGGSFTSLKAVLLAKAGRRREVQRAIECASSIGGDFGHFHHTAHNIASAYSAIYEPEEAVRSLEIAADTGFPNYPYFDIDPNLDPIRRDQQFVKFMETLQKQWNHYRELI